MVTVAPHRVRMVVCGKIVVTTVSDIAPVFDTVHVKLSDCTYMHVGWVKEGVVAIEPPFKIIPITREEFLADVATILPRQDMMEIWQATQDEYVEACLKSGTPINWLT